MVNVEQTVVVRPLLLLWTCHVSVVARFLKTDNLSTTVLQPNDIPCVGHVDRTGDSARCTVKASYVTK